MRTKKPATEEAAKKTPARKPVAGTTKAKKATKTAKSHDPVQSLNRTAKRDAGYQASKPKPKPIPFVLKETYVQLTIDSKPFSLNSTHPTFERMVKALKAGKWKDVPRLISVAESLFDASQGNVTVKQGKVFYKGTEVDSTLTRRIIELINHKSDTTGMLLFMDHLYSNPEPRAIVEFFDWLKDNDLPITDDGYFLAYKSVRHDYTDTHTGSYDNSSGKHPKMDRNQADPNWSRQCSSGFHICSKQYGVYGSKIMAVKANPRDVLSANHGKLRVLEYEVLRELGSINEQLFRSEGFTSLEKKLVVEVKKERKELIQLLLSDKTIKKAIREGTFQPESIKKRSYGQLIAMAQKYKVVIVDMEAQ